MRYAVHNCAETGLQSPIPLNYFGRYKLNTGALKEIVSSHTTGWRIYIEQTLVENTTAQSCYPEERDFLLISSRRHSDKAVSAAMRFICVSVHSLGAPLCVLISRACL